MLLRLLLSFLILFRNYVYLRKANFISSSDSLTAL